jgi:hypothetical protein
VVILKTLQSFAEAAFGDFRPVGGLVQRDPRALTHRRHRFEVAVAPITAFQLAVEPGEVLVELVGPPPRRGLGPRGPRLPAHRQ